MGRGLRMGDTTKVEIPQRLLAPRLRLAIDRAMARPGPRRERRVLELISENPRGSRSSHVLHNIGAARRAWLARLDATPDRASFVPFSSLSDDEYREWQEYLIRKVIQMFKLSDDEVVQILGEQPMVRKNEKLPEVELPPTKKKGDVPQTPIKGDIVPEKKG